MNILNVEKSKTVNRVFSKSRIAKMVVINFSVIFVTEFIIMNIIGGDGSNALVDNLADSLVLGITSSIFICLFIIKPILKKALSEQKNTLNQQLQLNYFEQQVEGLNKAAIVALTDSHGIIKFVNDKFCEISGYSREELVGKTHKIVNSGYHPEIFFKRMWQTISSGDIWNGEIKNRKKNGGYYWVNTYIVPLKDEQNQITEYLVIRYDVTKSKERENLLNELLEITTEGFWLVDLNGKLRDVNNAYIEMSGYSKHELMSMKISDLEAVERPEEVKKHIEKVIKFGSDTFDTIHKRKDGTLLHVEINTTYVPSLEGNLVVLIRDITEKKNILDQLVKEKDEVKKLSDAKSQFLSKMSHEIRTPLGGVIGLTKLLIENNSTDFIRDELERILGSSESLLYILNEVLDYSKLEAGKIQLDPVPFRLGQVMNDVIMLFKPIAKTKNINLELLMDSNIQESLHADAFRIKQILINLTSNAIKFTHDGRVTLECILMNESSQNICVKFKVIDTGIGIKDEDIQKLIQPFVQVDNSISRKFGGTGLGLAISNELLRIMNSSLVITSELGKGSTFEFSLDLQKSTLNHLITENSKSEKLSDVFAKLGDLSAYKVLVAEDDHVNQVVISKYLSLLKLKHKIVENGKECLNEFSSSTDKSYNLILMDIHMPVMDELEATKLIRGSNTKIPIVSLSAAITSEEINECKNVGMNDMLSKPIEPKKLASVFEKYLLNTTLN